MGADYSFEVKNIEIWVPAFFKHKNSSVATVTPYAHTQTLRSQKSEVRSQDLKMIGSYTNFSPCWSYPLSGHARVGPAQAGHAKLGQN